MYLQNLSLINFKNYSQAELQLSQKINCFVGNNGGGKTNILDAIFYLSFCKSYFNSVDSQNIKHGENFFVIQGTYKKDESTETIYCGVKQDHEKQFKRNKKVYEKLSDHIGLLPLVMVSPSDIELISEGSEERRRFINSVISQYDKQYLEDVIKYNRALKQRNTILKEFARRGNFDRESIEIWDEILITLGSSIYKKRLDFIEKLVPVFQKYYDFVSLGNEKVELIYESQLHHNNLRSLLNSSLEKDRIIQHTSVGIHKDDLMLNLSGFPIKKIGSQGQNKTFLIALKFAQFEFIKNINGYKPILLLDDIFDKLDNQRVKQIIKLVVDNNFGQIFISDTSKERIVNILSDIEIEYNIFTVSNGEVQ